MTQCIKTRFVGLDVHKDTIVDRGRRARAGGGAGGRYGATRMEGLEKGARQAGPSFRGCLLL